jgi:hypothetical protein
VALARPGAGRGERPELEPEVTVRRFRFRGERSTVRDRAVKSALQMLRLDLDGAGDAPLIWEVRA